MEFIEKIILAISPEAAARRQEWRMHYQRLYEAASNSIYRKKPGSQGSANNAMDRAGGKIRDWARHLDENHDLAIGVLDTLVNNIVGTGVIPDPVMRKKNGDIHEDFAMAVLDLWQRWEKHPDVTGTLSLAEFQRLSCRTWLRDGEHLIQHVMGERADLEHLGPIPYSIEVIEPDLLPFEATFEDDGIIHGVELDGWGRPRGYHVLKKYPEDRPVLALRPRLDDLSFKPATIMSHIKFTRRFKQVRDTMEDIKDIEESERIAAKVASNFTAVITKHPESTLGDSGNISSGVRNMTMQAGMIYDQMLPGEDVKVIGSDRPNPNLIDYRDSQMQAVSAGTSTGASQISRKYPGSYSAQRQETVNDRPAYGRLRNYWTWATMNDIGRHLVESATLSGYLKIPRDLDVETMFDFEWIAPALDWVDPLKEVKADELALALKIKSRAQIIAERTGRNPRLVMKQIEMEAAAEALADPIDDGGDDTGDPDENDNAGSEAGNEAA